MSINPKKRLEDGFEQSFWHTRPAIADEDRRRIGGVFEREFDRCAFRRMAHSVADDVLDRAPEQFRLALDRARIVESNEQAASFGLGFERTVVGDVSNQVVEADLCRLQGRRIAFNARKLKQFVDQDGEPVGFSLDSAERGPRIVAGAREIDGDVEARQRRAKFVRNVLQEPSFGE